MYQDSTSRATIYLERPQYGSQPKGSARGTCRNEQTVGGRVENMMSSIQSSSLSQRVLESLRTRIKGLCGPCRSPLNQDVSHHSDHILSDRPDSSQSRRVSWPPNRKVIYTWRGMIRLRWHVGYGLIPIIKLACQSL